MANLGSTFDASTVEPNRPPELLPPARYVVQIVASEMRVTKDGHGQYLWFEMDILEGPYQGRKLFEQLNLVNANAQTVEIARRNLSAICHAVGKMQVQDSEELHLIPFIADVRVKQPNQGEKDNAYGPKNTARYLPIEGATAAPAPHPTSPQPAAAKPAASAPAPTAKPAAAAPPWRRTA
jgi:hypothetical protein